MDTFRYRATVEYDGTDFKGFQYQARGERTVQGTLEEALDSIVSCHTRVIGAGRTDSGVHAEGQTIAFNVQWRHSEGALGRALNANLPPDVAVRDVKRVREDFHPRFDARRRKYLYRINNCIDPSPLKRRFTWHRSESLDMMLLNKASAHLVGEHDFGTFGRPPVGNNTVRRIFRANWEQEEEEVRFLIEGNAFLNRMVRRLVGSLCLVGDGRWTVVEFINRFAAASRTLAGPLAPPQGLCLISVAYDER